MNARIYTHGAGPPNAKRAFENDYLALFILITGVASPRGKYEIQQAKEEQLEISASGGEVSVLDVGTNPVIETWSLASVTLPPPYHQLAIKEVSDSLSVLQLDTIKYDC